MIDEECQEMVRLAKSEGAFLWNQALCIAGRKEDAENLLQETLLRACRGFGGFRLDTNFRAWARKIMINAHINKARKPAATVLSIEELNREALNFFAGDSAHVSNTDDPEKVFFHSHIREEIADLFRLLPEKYRTAFLLFHINEYTYIEISKIVNAPVGTVKSRIYRAKQWLTNKTSGAQFTADAARYSPPVKAARR